MCASCGHDSNGSPRTLCNSASRAGCARTCDIENPNNTPCSIDPELVVWVTTAIDRLVNGLAKSLDRALGIKAKEDARTKANFKIAKVVFAERRKGTGWSAIEGLTGHDQR